MATITDWKAIDILHGSGYRSPIIWMLPSSMEVRQMFALASSRFRKTGAQHLVRLHPDSMTVEQGSEQEKKT